jgi:hypothetical protein
LVPFVAIGTDLRFKVPLSFGVVLGLLLLLLFYDFLDSAFLSFLAYLPVLGELFLLYNKHYKRSSTTSFESLFFNNFNKLFFYLFFFILSTKAKSNLTTFELLFAIFSSKFFYETSPLLRHSSNLFSKSLRSFFLSLI